jgi:EAL domain-containing protein (putative c-di-GMP-specific phosphodiesterase class I)
VAGVEPDGVQGLALWSRSLGVAVRLSREFDPDPAAPLVYHACGHNWQQRVRKLLGDLTTQERQGLLAAPIPPDGRVDPWQASPVDQILQQLETAWFPGMMTATAHDKRGGMVPYLQPIVAVNSRQVVGFEALMRVEAQGQLRTAGEIVAAAKAYDALIRFDELARRVAMRHGLNQLWPGEKLFINFSPAAVCDPDAFLEQVWQTVLEIGWDPKHLVFEVVESERFGDLGRLRALLEGYRDMGVHVALDDVGSGYTALTYIHELHPDLIKIDRGLLPRQVTKGHLSLLQGIVDYAHSHGIRVVAEGIETVAQWEAVRQIGADLGQGWLLGRPAAVALRQLDSTAAAAS